MAHAPANLPIAFGDPKRVLTEPAPAEPPLIVIWLGSVVLLAERWLNSESDALTATEASNVLLHPL